MGCDTKTPTRGNPNMKRIAVCLLALSLLAPALYARDKAAPTAPGTYKVWGPDIDQIEIVKTFKTADYDHVVVQTFDTSATPLPEKSEKSYNSVKSVLDAYTLTLVEALRPELKAKADVTASDQSTKDARTLIVRGKVEEL